MMPATCLVLGQWLGSFLTEVGRGAILQLQTVIMLSIIQSRHYNEWEKMRNLPHICCWYSGPYRIELSVRPLLLAASPV